MRLYLIIFILLTGCLSKKLTYMCGDVECIDKKQQNEYFSKSLSLEVKLNKNKKYKSLDLIEINKVDNKEKKNNIKILPSGKDKSKKNELKKKKFELKQKKKQLKAQRLKERKSRKEQKKLLKSKNKENQRKAKKTKPFIPSLDTTKNISKENNICSVIEECDIDVIASQIKQRGKIKKFPDIARD